MKLIATRSYSYNTRRLKAGDEFDTTNDMHARILVGARKAKYAAEHGKPAVQPAARVVEPKPEPEDNGATLDSLRAQAERLGIAVDGRWGVARLQHEIMQAKRR
jgi:hypothetical protein